MSEEIKYEPVFGPQELFNSASDDAVLAIKDTTSGRIHIFTNDWNKCSNFAVFVKNCCSNTNH